MGGTRALTDGQPAGQSVSQSSKQLVSGIRQTKAARRGKRFSHGRTVGHGNADGRVSDAGVGRQTIQPGEVAGEAKSQ